MICFIPYIREEPWQQRKDHCLNALPVGFPEASGQPLWDAEPDGTRLLPAVLLATNGNFLFSPSGMEVYPSRTQLHDLLPQPVLAGVIGGVCFLSTAVIFSTMAACIMNRRRAARLRKRRQGKAGQREPGHEGVRMGSGRGHESAPADWVGWVERQRGFALWGKKNCWCKRRSRALPESQNYHFHVHPAESRNSGQPWLLSGCRNQLFSVPRLHFLLRSLKLSIGAFCILAQSQNTASGAEFGPLEPCVS